MKVRLKDGTEIEALQIYLSDRNLTARTKRKYARLNAADVSEIGSNEWELTNSNSCS